MKGNKIAKKSQQQALTGRGGGDPDVRGGDSDRGFKPEES